MTRSRTPGRSSTVLPPGLTLEYLEALASGRQNAALIRIASASDQDPFTAKRNVLRVLRRYHKLPLDGEPTCP